MCKAEWLLQGREWLTTGWGKKLAIQLHEIVVTPEFKSYWELSTWVDKQGDLMLSCSRKGDPDTSGLGCTFEKDRLLESRSQQILLRNEVE